MDLYVFIFAFSSSSVYCMLFCLGRLTVLLQILRLKRGGILFSSELLSHFFLHHGFYRVQKPHSLIDGVWTFVGDGMALSFLISHDSFSFLFFLYKDRHERSKSSIQFLTKSIQFLTK